MEIKPEELSLEEEKNENLPLLDNSDKPFMIIYIFIYLLGVLLTIISIYWILIRQLLI